MSASGDGEGAKDGGPDRPAGRGGQPANGGGRSERTGHVDLLVNRREGRVRAGWRVVGWLLVVVLAAIVGLAVQEELVALAPTGPPTALAGVAGGAGLYAVVAGATVVYARQVDQRDATDLGLGLGGPYFSSNLAVGLALGVAMATTVFLVGMGFDAVRILDTLVVDPAASVVPGGTAAGAVVGDLQPLVVAALLLVFYVGVGVGEEVLVRGYLLTNVAEGLAGLVDERAAIALAILATGGLFGALHYANPGASVRSAAAITAVGVVLGWTYAVSGDLGIPIGIHVTWNFALGAVFGFPVSGLAPPAALLGIEVTGDSLLMGGSFGPEAGLVMVVPLVLAVVVTVLWVRRTTGDLSLQTEIARYRRE